MLGLNMLLGHDAERAVIMILHRNRLFAKFLQQFPHGGNIGAIMSELTPGHYASSLSSRAGDNGAESRPAFRLGAKLNGIAGKAQFLHLGTGGGERGGQAAALMEGIAIGAQRHVIENAVPKIAVADDDAKRFRLQMPGQSGHQSPH